MRCQRTGIGNTNNQYSTARNCAPHHLLMYTEVVSDSAIGLLSVFTDAYQGLYWSLSVCTDAYQVLCWCLSVCSDAYQGLW